MKFTADTHFSSQRALELSKRPYKSVKEMDEDIIKLWNENILPDEIVYHLGDFGNYDIIKRLNGKVHLILGNYEIKDINEGKITKEELINMGFASVNDYLYLDFLDEGYSEVEKLKLVHKPSDCDINDCKIFNLFGHIHGKQLCKRFGLDVGVDGHHMRPIDIEDVYFYMHAIKNGYDNEVFM